MPPRDCRGVIGFGGRYDDPFLVGLLSDDGCAWEPAEFCLYKGRNIRVP